MGFGSYKKTYWVEVTEKEMETHRLIEGIILLIIMIVIFSGLLVGILSAYP